MTFILAANGVAQVPVAIDKVCIGSIRTYRVDGETGLTYHWILTDSLNNILPLANPSGTPFTDTDSGGNLVVGSEIEIGWNYDPGVYSLKVEKQSIYNCISDTIGTIEIVPLPVINAGPDRFICAGNTLLIYDASGSDYDPLSLVWTTSGDGTFDNPNLLKPVYYAGPNDLISGTVQLTITVEGFGNSGSCLPVSDDLSLTVSPLPKLVIHDPSPVCEPSTVDLDDALIYTGSEPGLNHEFYTDLDGTIPLTNYNAVDQSGTYYIKAINPVTKCFIIKPVNATINPKPLLVITNPPPVCEPNKVNLTALSITAGSDPGLIFKYYTDTTCTTLAVNYTAIASSGKYFIKATNTNGCSSVGPVVVTINPTPVLVLTNPPAVCEPSTVNLTSAAWRTGSIIPPSTSFSYWTNAAASDPLNDPTKVSVSATYFIKAETPGGCSHVQPITVVVNPRPIVVVHDPLPVCQPLTVDLSDPAVTAGSNAASYQYFTDTITPVPLVNYQAVSQSGAYFIKGINPTGCYRIKPVTVIINPVPILVITDPEPVCENETVDLTLPEITAGSTIPALSVFSYWKNLAATIPVPDEKAVKAGTYYIKVETPGGCKDIQPVKVTSIPLPLLALHDPSPVCEPNTINLSDSAVFAGSEPDLLFAYFRDSAALIPAPDYAAVSASGVYYIRGTNKTTGCSSIDSVKVTIIPKPLLVITDPPAVCEPNKIDLSNASIIAGSEPGLNYEYYSDLLGTIPLANYTAIGVSGTYYIKAINQITGCSDIKPVTVTINPQPILAITNPDAACEPETVDLSAAAVISGSIIPASSVFSYWLDPLATNAVTDEKAISVSGTYYIKVVAPGGCFDIQPVQVTINPKPLLVIHDPADVCEPATVDLTAPAIVFGSNIDMDYEYYTDADGTLPVTNPDKVSVGGTYYIKGIHQVTRCSDIKPVNVIVHPLLVPEFNVINDLCVNSTPPLLQVISNNGIAGTWSPSTISTAAKGVTAYTFTPAPTVCASKVILNVSVIDKLNPVFTPIDPICQNQVAPNLPTVSNNGVVGNWSPALITTTTPGTYSFTFTPLAGLCAKDTTIQVTIGEEVNPIFDKIGPLCYNSTPPDLPNTSLNGISGTWSPATISTSTSGPTSYSFIPDGGFCVNNSPMEILVTTPLTLIETHKNIGYSADPIGSIDLSVFGGYGLYSYKWSNGETTQDIDSLDAGTYKVIVTDEIGCSDSISVTITRMELMTLAAVGFDSPCPGVNGRIDFTFTNVPDGEYEIFYDYSSFQQVNIIAGQASVSVPPGVYNNLYLVYLGNQTISKNVNVTIRQLPEITIAATGFQSNCNNVNGTIEFNFSNVPDGFYDITYDGGVFTGVQVINNWAGITAIAKKYTNLKLELNLPGCSTNSVDVTLDKPKGILPISSVIQPTCFLPSGKIEVTYPSGPDYEYSNNGGLTYQDSEVFDNLNPGNYGIKAREKSTGCESEIAPETIYSTPNPPENAIVDMTPPTCDLPTGSITITNPTFGLGYEYSLDGLTYQDSKTFNGLTPGESYNLRVRIKSNGCESITIVPIDTLPPPVPAPVASVTVQPDCRIPTGTIVITSPALGTGYVYSLDGINYQGTTLTYQGLSPGTYQLRVRSILSTNCVSELKELIIVAPVPPETPVVTSTDPDCNIKTGSVRVESPLADNLLYSIDGGKTYQPSPLFEKLNPNSSLVVKVMDSTTGCESETVPKNIGPAPIPLAAPVKISDLEECSKTPIQTLDARDAIVPVAGITVIWYDQPSGGNVVASPTLNTVDNKPTYYAESFDGICHSETRTPVKLSILQVPAAPTFVRNLTECEKYPIQTLNANFGISLPQGASVTWYDSPTGGNVVNKPTLNTVNSVTYYAESTIGPCSGSPRTPVTLTINPSPTITILEDSVVECALNPMQIIDARNYVTTEPGAVLNWYDLPTGRVKVVPILDQVGWKTYYVEAFNGQCDSTKRYPIVLIMNPMPEKPTVQITKVPECVEPTGTVEITNPTGTELTYNVDNGIFQTSVSFSNLSPGSHSFKTRNNKTGCESDTTIFRVPDLPPMPGIIDVTTVDCICYGDSGVINFEFKNVPDGTYIIIYMGGQFENVEVKDNKAQVIAPAGNYQVLAIEANGCKSTENWNVTITQPDQLSVSAKITEIDLKSNQKGEIDITITGGTGNYSAIWEPNLTSGFAGATTEDIINLNSGLYTVTVTDINGCQVVYTDTIPKPNLPPVATNDEFDAKCSAISGDLMYTNNGNGIDYDPDGDSITIQTSPVRDVRHGTLTINPDGTFEYQAFPGYTGDDSFRYRIFDIKKNPSIPGIVIIHVVADFDCDGIPDDVDPDADGDGILNVNEGDLTTDSDGDGHPNWLDIDADNDGIVDNVEGQATADYRPPMDTDTDHDGINDAYDTDNGGTALVPIDTDGDGIQDFLDVDSDNDGVPDYIEGHDENADGKIDAGHKISGKDFDSDGLDDAWDTENRFEEPIANITGSNAPIQDFDGDGLKDWRDENDDDDEYLTRFEDLNMDGDWSNDDTDEDGHPEYLDFGRDCDLFIPNAFSPNGDNIHDYFQIYCINHFPNAKIYIFDQLGNLLYEQEHYGNLNFWPTPQQAWWDGRTKNRAASTNKDGRVVPATYFYVLKLGNGEVRKSFVFISY
jgi:gliding motility-associated-like protein